MNKIFFTKRTSILLLAISLFSSCMEKDVYQGDKNTPLNPTEVFDFSLTKEVKLNVDYGFTNDYYIIFELYNQNPMKEENNSWIKDEKLSPSMQPPQTKRAVLRENHHPLRHYGNMDLQ